jgi:exosortase
VRAAVASRGTHSRQSSISPLAGRVLLVVVLAELVFLYAPTVRWLVERWTMSVWHNAHGFMIPLVVGYFVSQELERTRSLPTTGSAWGFLFLVPALAVHVLDTGIHTQILSAISIVIALPGLSLLFIGPERTRLIAVPLAFSVFMLPIPLAATEPLQLALRQIATAGSAATLPLVGVSVYAEATTLHLANGTLIIADACSGFSTLYAACAVAALTAYSCNSWRGRLLALGAAVPLAIAANLLRVIFLAVMVRRTGIDVLETWMHPASGLLTFALALPAILWLGRPRQDWSGAAATDSADHEVAPS